jgi:hypothetical protein
MIFGQSRSIFIQLWKPIPLVELLLLRLSAHVKDWHFSMTSDFHRMPEMRRKN